MDLATTLTRRPAGYTVAGQAMAVQVAANAPLIVRADWHIPSNFTSGFYDSQGHLYLPGSTVPVGVSFTQGFNVPVGFAIPADVFPDGLPIAPTIVHYAAGSVLDLPITLAAGSSLIAGAVLARPVAVAPTATLSTGLFQSGFSHYTVTASDGIVVAPGTRIEVNMPVLRADVDGLQSLPTGARLAAALPRCRYGRRRSTRKTRCMPRSCSAAAPASSSMWAREWAARACSRR
jgi:hypothetical protein